MGLADAIVMASLVVVAAACSTREAEPAQRSVVTVSTTNGVSPASQVAQQLARTLNLGRTLEFDRDEEPTGPALDAADLADIAGAGFTAVRVPVNFATWAAVEPPYLIEQEIFDRVDEVIEAATSNGLAVIIDLHQYDAINEAPEAHAERLVELWAQIADRYRQLPTDSVAFEVLNEPNSALTSETWNTILADAVSRIRSIDAGRTIVVGPANWYDHEALADLELPDDGNLIVSFHYYSPFEFTHQGAHWIDGTEYYVGTRWSASEGADVIAAHFAAVADWAADREVPVFLGEFGSYADATYADRVEWTRSVRETAEAEGFAWGYWDWAGAGFGLQDDSTGAWDDGLLDALMG